MNAMNAMNAILCNNSFSESPVLKQNPKDPSSTLTTARKYDFEFRFCSFP
jgi:hypothetical protein